MNNHILINKSILFDKRLSAIDRIVYFALIAVVDQNKEKCRYKYNDIYEESLKYYNEMNQYTI